MNWVRSEIGDVQKLRNKWGTLQVEWGTYSRCHDILNILNLHFSPFLDKAIPSMVKSISLRSNQYLQ